MTLTAGGAAATWRDGVLYSLVAFDPSQPRDEEGQWTSDGSDQEAAKGDAEAKALYAQLLNMPPEQRDAFLAKLNPDQLTRLGQFASLGKATDGPIADIRNKTGQAMAKRGLDPKAAGLKSKGGKKKAAAKKGGAKKSGSGGGSKGGGGGGKKSGGGGSSKKSAPKKPTPKPKAEPKKAEPKPTKPVPAPPTLLPTPGRPGAPRPGGPPSTQPVSPVGQGRRKERRRRPALRSSAALWADAVTAAYSPNQPRIPSGEHGGRWMNTGGRDGNGNAGSGRGKSGGGSGEGGGGSGEGGGGSGEGGGSKAATHADEITRSNNPAGAARELSDDELGAVDREMGQRAAALGKPGQVSKAHQKVKDELAKREQRAAKKSGQPAAKPDAAPSPKPAAPSARPSTKPAPSTGKAHDKARDSVDDGDQDRLASAFEDAGVDDPEDAADQIMSMSGGKKAQKAAVDRLVAARRPLRSSGAPKSLADWNAARARAARARREATA